MLKLVCFKGHQVSVWDTADNTIDTVMDYELVDPYYRGLKIEGLDYDISSGNFSVTRIFAPPIDLVKTKSEVYGVVVGLSVSCGEYDAKSTYECVIHSPRESLYRELAGITHSVNGTKVEKGGFRHSVTIIGRLPTDRFELHLSNRSPLRVQYSNYYEDVYYSGVFHPSTFWWRDEIRGNELIGYGDNIGSIAGYTEFGSLLFRLRGLGLIDY